MIIRRKMNRLPQMAFILFRQPIAIRVLLAAAVGIPLATVFVDPFISALTQYYKFGNDHWLKNANIFDLMLLRISWILVAPIVVSPLVIIAVLISVAFRKSIDKYPAIWCCVAPISIWLFVCVFTGLIRDNPYGRSHTFLENIVASMSQISSLLFLIGPIPAAIFFYILTRHHKSNERNLLGTE